MINTHMLSHPPGLPWRHRGWIVPCWPHLATLRPAHLETQCFFCPGLTWLTPACPSLSLPDGVHRGRGVEGDPRVWKWMESARYGNICIHIIYEIINKYITETCHCGVESVFQVQMWCILPQTYVVYTVCKLSVKIALVGFSHKKGCGGEKKCKLNLNMQ